MKQIRHVADRVAAGLVVESLLSIVLSIQILKILHTLLIRLIGENNILMSESSSLDLLRLQEPHFVVFFFYVEDAKDQNTSIEDMISGEPNKDAMVKRANAQSEKILLLLEELVQGALLSRGGHLRHRRGGLDDGWRLGELIERFLNVHFSSILAVHDVDEAKKHEEMVHERQLWKQTVLIGLAVLFLFSEDHCPNVLRVST